MIENPRGIHLRSFSSETFKNATLYVPVGTINKYKTNDGWRQFAFIQEGLPSSITDIETKEAKERKRYTLDGKVVNNSHKGINIIQMNNGTTKKVVVR